METEVLSSEFTSELYTISACESGLSLQPEENALNGGAGAAAAAGEKESTQTSTFSRNESADTLSRGSGPQKRRAEKNFAGQDVERRYKICLRAEIVGLSVLIVIVWGLLSLPIVFYHIPAVSE